MHEREGSTATERYLLLVRDRTVEVVEAIFFYMPRAGGREHGEVNVRLI